MAKLTNEYIFYGKTNYENNNNGLSKFLKKIIALIIMVKFTKAKPTIVKLIMIKLIMVRFDSN
jgi:hypothetical protein